ncbi:MAG: Zn-ribbon domain-containing OB-fold protein [Lautropia sp.]
MIKSNPNLFHAPGEIEGAPGLKGTRCADCGSYTLLEVPVCQMCLSRNVAPACIGTRATLTRHSTVLHSADSFEAPYVIGQIRTLEGPTTFAPILAADPSRLHEGLALQFSLIPLGDGGRTGFAYVPAEAST